MDPQLTVQLIKSRQALKKKYKSLKSDIVNSQSQLEKTYQPITQPLKQLVNVLGKPSEPIKPESFSPKFEKTNRESYKLTNISPEEQTIGPQFSSTQFPSFLKDVETFETADDVFDEDQSTDDKNREDQFIDDTISQYLQTASDPNVLREYFDQYESPLPREFIEGMVRDVKGEYDHILGVFHDPVREKFFIGDSEIDFKGPDIIVKGVTYKGRPGLYELLFKKNPIVYGPKNDVSDYVDIIKRTNAIYRDFNPQLPIKKFPGDVKYKYIDIIKPGLKSQLSYRPRTSSLPSSLFKGVLTRNMTKRGGGVHGPLIDGPLTNKYNNNPIEYVYFNVYNELIDRLRLLVASQVAGNTSHNNEIISIIEELKEGRIIA